MGNEPFTVAHLLKALEGLPLDMPVCVTYDGMINDVASAEINDGIIQKDGSLRTVFLISQGW